MKVKELIEKLKAFDPETAVVVGGFDEEGFADLTRVQAVKITPRKSGADIFGEYQKPQAGDQTMQALWLDHGGD